MRTLQQVSETGTLLYSSRSALTHRFSLVHLRILPTEVKERGRSNPDGDDSRCKVDEERYEVARPIDVCVGRLEKAVSDLIVKQEVWYVPRCWAYCRRN